MSACLRTLAQLEGTERAVVLTQEPGEGPAVRVLQGNLEPGDLATKESPGGFALHVASTDRKSVHSLDVHQDPVFAACARRSEGKSVLVVPIVGSSGPCGFLYADHTSKAGAFPHADLRRVEAFAADIGPRLELALAASRAAPRQAVSTEHHVALRTGAGLLILALLWAGTGVVFHTRSRPAPPPPPPSVAQATPQVVAASYLSMLRFKQASSAYELLSPHQQKRIPRERFEKEVNQWLLDRRNSWEIDYRRAGAATVVGRRADVVIQPAPGTKAWNYRLVQETDGGPWKLDHWDGGPLVKDGSAEK